MATCVRKPLLIIHSLKLAMPIVALLYWHATVASAITFQDFDTPDAGSRYSTSSKQCAASDSVPAVISDEPIGKFLRLATVIGSDAKAQNSTITFELTDPDSADQVIVDFDFRITLVPGYGRADGMGFALLSSKVYKDSVVCPELPPYGAEEPNFAGSLGVGFDIYRNPEYDAIGDTDKPYSHISVHFDSTAARKEIDASSKLDLAK